MAAIAASSSSSSLLSPFSRLTSAAISSLQLLPRRPSLRLRSLATKPQTLPLNPLSSLPQSFRSTPLRASSVAAASASSSAAVAVQEKPIAVGDKLPDGELSYLDNDDQLQTLRVSELTKNKKVVLFAVPGAFTPTCSQKHVPGFIEKADKLKAKGVDTIACISVNDVYVLKAWGESLGTGEKVLLLADAGAEFTKALGVTLDLTGSPKFSSLRSRRYALLAEDGVVKVLNLEEGGSFTISSAEEILKAL